MPLHLSLYTFESLEYPYASAQVELSLGLNYQKLPLYLHQEATRNLELPKLHYNASIICLDESEKKAKLHAQKVIYR